MGNLENDVEIILLVIISSLIASGGFWAWVMKRRESTSATTRLLMGLAHDKIVTNGMRAINRGFIHHEEYQDLCRYLYEPYIELGGNGVVERVMGEVSKLPLVEPQKHFTPSKESHVQQRIRTSQTEGVSDER